MISFQVRLDLGSGEAILWSPVALALNDLAWHYVHLVHSQGKVKLTIDRIYETNTKTKGQLFELNINHIFLGGMGTFDIFRGNFNNFRGCMRYVLFNTIDVFHDVRLQNNPMNLYEVSWDCSPEFGASSDQPISLLRNTSYIAFPHLHAREGGTVAFDLRTKSDTALVLYNSGHVTNRDFVALELIEGKIRVTLDKGSGPLVLDSGIKVNDGRWHQVEFIVTFNSLEVIIDDKRKDLRSNFGNQRYLDLVGHLFIGGVGLSSRAHAIKKGLYSLRGTYASAGSLLGCIRNLKLNDRLSGLGEAEVTHGIRPNCVWQYSCNRRPCVNDAVCTEEGYTGFRCECGKSNCYKSPEEIDPAVSMSDLVALQNVRVREGTRTIITSNNIDVTLEYARYNLRDSDVIFRVVTPPKHGQVFVDITKGSGTPTFTLQHLNNDKVFYIHDGSESKDDSIGIELSFDRTITNLPSQLRHKYGFALFVRISPENDRPVMKLPQDDTLIVVEKTSTRITPKIMSVVDDDTEPDHLIYTVEYQDSDQIGFFEKADNPGEQVSTFSQEDINVGIISYVHRGMKRLHVRLQVGSLL